MLSYFFNFGLILYLQGFESQECPVSLVPLLRCGGIPPSGDRLPGGRLGGGRGVHTRGWGPVRALVAVCRHGCIGHGFTALRWRRGGGAPVAVELCHLPSAREEEYVGSPPCPLPRVGGQPRWRREKGGPKDPLPWWPLPERLRPWMHLLCRRVGCSSKCSFWWWPSLCLGLPPFWFALCP